MDTQVTQLTDLFQPVRLGPLTLQNRVVMAPLTRSRAAAGDVPTAMNATYYRQRAEAGLIISEASQISPQGKGYAWTPGIYSDAQIAGWRLVTDAVHEAGGLIYCQLWHVGRISHPDLQQGHVLPVSASAIRPRGKAFTETGFQPIPTPRPLRTDEIPGLIADYAHAATAAKKAGFDGVEIHAANGYLIDQFLRTKTNYRTDLYGGTLENRLRLLTEVTRAVVGVWGGDRVGVRLAPVSGANDVADADPATTFGTAVQRLDSIGVIYIHIVEGQTIGPRDTTGFDFGALQRSFRGLYIANNGYTRDLALQARREHTADLVAFGRPWPRQPRPGHPPAHRCATDRSQPRNLVRRRRGRLH
ncbi:MAG: alkene reductase [Rhodospirillales bacterium]